MSPLCNLSLIDNFHHYLEQKQPPPLNTPWDVHLKHVFLMNSCNGLSYSLKSLCSSFGINS